MDSSHTAQWLAEALHGNFVPCCKKQLRSISRVSPFSPLVAKASLDQISTWLVKDPLILLL